MSGPLFFIVWGTQTRLRPLGIWPAYCNGCLHLTKNRVTSVQNAPHIYYISVSYSEVDRFSECPLCGSVRYQSSKGAFIDGKIAEQTSIQDLIRHYRSDFTSEFLRAQEGETRSWNEAQREAHIFTTFCGTHEAEFVFARERLEAWCGLIFLLLAIPAGIIAAMEGRTVGIIAGIGLCALWFVIRDQLIQAVVGRKIRPRLRHLLRACRRDMRYFQHWIEAAAPKYKFLNRHLGSMRYNGVRWESARMIEYKEPVSEWLAPADFK